jgi:hypothetical protein
MLQNVRYGLADPQLLFISDEAYFHFSCVSSQTTWIWSDKNPQALHQVPLHDTKGGVWCAARARQITGPLFFYVTMNLNQYVHDIYEQFFRQMTDEERQYDHFQQDGEISHTANNSKIVLQEMFHDRNISTRLLPPVSPDLSVCNFYL